MNEDTRTQSEKRLDLKEHLTWMLDQIRIGNQPEHFYHNYRAYRNDPLLSEEDNKYFEETFEKEIQKYYERLTA